MARVDKVLHSWGPGESWYALVASGDLVEIIIDRGGHRLGTIWLGRVVQVNRAINAAFVDIGDDQPGYLQGEKVNEGQIIAVQIAAEAQGGKGAKLTANLALHGAYSVFTPMRSGISVARKLDDKRRERLQAMAERLAMPGEGLILLPEAAKVDEDELGPEIKGMRRAWEQIEKLRDTAKAPALLYAPEMLDQIVLAHPHVVKIITDDAASFADFRSRFGEAVEHHKMGPVLELHAVDLAIEDALSTSVKLPCGGALIIQQTRALTAIDIDSGGAAPLDANKDAVTEVARQLRLRNLGGQIVVDFIPVGKKGNLFQPMQALRGKVKSDPVPTHVLGVGPLGLVEIQRERRRKSLPEMLLTGPADSRKSDLTLGLEALRRITLEAPRLAGQPGLAAAPGVIDALRAQKSGLTEAEARLKTKITLRPEPGRRPDDYQIFAV